jgi:hypothetical protein
LQPVAHLENTVRPLYNSNPPSALERQLSPTADKPPHTPNRRWSKWKGCYTEAHPEVVDADLAHEPCYCCVLKADIYASDAQGGTGVKTGNQEFHFHAANVSGNSA